MANPTNIKEVRGLTGLTGYYKHFVQHYGSMAALLSQLLKGGGAFEWNEEAYEAFERLKRAMMTLPVQPCPTLISPLRWKLTHRGMELGPFCLNRGGQLRIIATLCH